MKEQLIGKWKIDPADKKAYDLYGNVNMEFCPNGKLIYTTYDGGNAQSIILTYRISGDLLITDQPSHPREDSSKFELLPDGRLKLFNEGISSTYIKV